MSLAKANEKRAVDGRSDTPLTSRAVRRGEQAHFFVVAEGGGVRPTRAASSPISFFGSWNIA